MPKPVAVRHDSVERGGIGGGGGGGGSAGSERVLLRVRDAVGRRLLDVQVLSLRPPTPPPKGGRRSAGAANVAGATVATACSIWLLPIPGSPTTRT